MEKNKQRMFPQGLCETCFWRFQCGYAVDNPNETVSKCDDDGGLSYQEDKQIVELRKTDLSETMPVQARIRKPENGEYLTSKSRGPNINIGTLSDFISNQTKRLSVHWRPEPWFGCRKSLNLQICLKNYEKNFSSSKINLIFVPGLRK